MWRVAGLIFVGLPDRAHRRGAAGAARRRPGPLGDGDLRVLIWRARASRSDRRSPRAGPCSRASICVLLGLAAAIVSARPDQGWIALFYFASTAASMLLPEGAPSALIGVAGIVAAICLTATQDVAERTRPGPVHVDHRDHGVRHDSAAAHERQAVRGAAGACHAGRRRRSATGSPAICTTFSATACRVIAIKSELAGRLLPGDPERARAEIAGCRAGRARIARIGPRDGERLPSADPRPRAGQRPRRPRCGRDRADDRPQGRATPGGGGRRPRLGGPGGGDQRRPPQCGAPRDDPDRAPRRAGGARGARRRASARRPDDAAGASTDGIGLRGLRERLESAGGRLEAGPRADRRLPAVRDGPGRNVHSSADHEAQGDPCAPRGGSIDGPRRDGGAVVDGGRPRGRRTGRDR